MNKPTKEARQRYAKTRREKYYENIELSRRKKRETHRKYTKRYKNTMRLNNCIDALEDVRNSLERMNISSAEIYLVIKQLKEVEL